MTDELTLREKVRDVLFKAYARGQAGEIYSPDMNAICDALEDTGAPAHMRVAAELRGGVMAAVVWKKGAFRVRRLHWSGWQYLGEGDGYWWMEAGPYNAFKTAEVAEAEYVRIRPRRVKIIK